MSVYLRSLLTGLIIFLSVSSASLYAEELTPFTPSTIEYSATYNGLPINVVRQLSHMPSGEYALSSRAKNMLGSIEESGTFTLNSKQQIQNTHYRYKRSILGNKKKQRLVFDHTDHIATYKSGDKTRQVSLDKPYHNPISYQLQLQKDLMLDCEDLNYPVIAKGKAKNYQFKRIGEEVLETPIGSINAIKVQRIRENSNRETILWFAPELGYILVKLWQKEDSEDYQINLKSGTLNDVTLSTLANNASGKGL